MSHDPAEPRTLVEVLQHHAVRRPDQPIYTFLGDGEKEAGELTYAELEAQVRQQAAQLGTRLGPGSRVLLLFQPGLDFAVSFLACLCAGVVAVPAYPPASKRHLPRLRSIVRDSQPAALLTGSGLLSKIRTATERLPELADIALWTPEDLTSPGADSQLPEVDPATIAFLQYTSGSTAAPKGVEISHGNLMANERAIQSAFGLDASAVIVGWLPLYHDMGLIGNLLQPLYLGGRCIFMAPVAFLSRPRRWLEAIEHYRATVSGGPNFAYELCVDRITPADRAGLDLSSWQVAYNGAEPVRAGTLERFAEAYAPQGFQRRAFYPCYGMAETTLLASGGDAQREPTIRPFAADALEQDQARPPQADEEVRHLVGCGQAQAEHRISVVQPATLRPVADGRIGEIWVTGPSVARGYRDRPKVNAETFGARLQGDSATWLRTGDLGFLDQGELYVTGRLKDLIIIRGRNHYPQDIELTAAHSHPSLRADSGAAFAVDAEGEERLVIVHEVDRRPSDPPEVIVDAVRQAVAEEHAVAVWEVVLIRIASIAKTSSGKIQRRATRAAWESGGLTVISRSQLNAAVEGEILGTEIELDRDSLSGRPASEQRELIERFARQRLARLLRVPAGTIDGSQSLTAQGLDSLSAVELESAFAEVLGAALPLSAVLEGAGLDEVVDLALETLATEPTETDQPQPGEGGQQPPISAGQRALWYLHRLDPDSSAYNIFGAAKVDGKLDTAAFESALQQLVARHPALRTTYELAGDSPQPRVHAELRPEFVVHQTSGESPEALDQRLAAALHRPFDLAQGPLLRVEVFQSFTGEHHLTLAVHHIAADLWSLSVLLGELGALYGEAVGGPLANLAAPELDYSDWATWQNRRLATSGEQPALDYWRGQLAGELPVLDLPTDHPRPTVQTLAGNTSGRRFAADLAGRLEARAQEQGATLFALLMATYQTLLTRFSGQPEVIVGTPTAGDRRSGLADVVGYFVNPVAIRTRVGDDPTFDQLLARVRHTVIEGFEHRAYPFPLLVEELASEPDPSRSPIFQAMLVWQQDRRPEDAGLAGFALGEAGATLQLGPLRLESLALPQQSAQFDLSLRLAVLDGRLTASVEYNRDLFDSATAERLLVHFETLLEAVATDPSRRLSALPSLPESEARQLLAEWNPSPAAGESTTLHQLFHSQATRTPERTAVLHHERSITYGELQRAANRLAQRLRELGVGPEVPVAICAERSIEMVIGILGVLTAGGCYVPLDPAYPAERLKFSLEDSQAAVLLFRGEPPVDFTGHSAKSLDLAEFNAEGVPADTFGQLAGPPPNDSSPDQLAYVIYTSGSTGRPKGVAISHRSAAALVQWSEQDYSAADLEGVLASTSICFDLSIFELFVPLCRGGRVILAANALELPDLPAADQVTLLNTVPSAIAELVEHDSGLPPSLRVVNLAGEPLARELVERIYAQPAVKVVFDLYGPSEDTTYSTWARVPQGAGLPVLIGRPVAGTQAILIDRHLQLVPAGSTGEITLGGTGLARAYLGRPRRTAASWVPNPWSTQPGGRLYLTGDLGRHQSDGQIDFLGRRDHQVKVRGFRIELGEIESVLASTQAVAEAAVLARSDDPARPGDQQLVAYLVAAEEGSIDLALLREAASERLPGYMLPAAFVVLDQLPLTPNGKIDRRALPAPDPSSASSSAAFVAPSTAVEEALAEIWREVLGVEKIGIYDSFFELGGHSLKATRVLARVTEAFGVELSVRSLLEAPTINGLAEAIARGLLADLDEETAAALLAELE